MPNIQNNIFLDRMFAYLLIAIFGILLLQGTSGHCTTSELKTITFSNTDVAADSIVYWLDNGYNVKINNCQIAGRFIFHDSLTRSLNVFKCTFFDVVDFDNISCMSELVIANTVFKDSLLMRNAEHCTPLAEWVYIFILRRRFQALNRIFQYTSGSLRCVQKVKNRARPS